MTPRLLFAHGWALDRTLWDKVLSELGPQAEDAVVLDAGYYGAPSGAGRLDAGRPILGVGQSLGALELLAIAPAPLAGLVAIDGFARFAEAPDFPQGERTARLHVMARRMNTAAGAVVADFLARTRVELSPPPGRADPTRLSAGIRRLVALDGRKPAQGLPIWRLHASHDPIAPPALADASFAGAAVRALELRQAADHLSPITAPAACAALIRRALQALSA